METGECEGRRLSSNRRNRRPSSVPPRQSRKYADILDPIGVAGPSRYRPRRLPSGTAHRRFRLEMTRRLLRAAFERACRFDLARHQHPFYEKRAHPRTTHAFPYPLGELHRVTRLGPVSWRADDSGSHDVWPARKNWRPPTPGLRVLAAIVDIAIAVFGGRIAPAWRLVDRPKRLLVSISRTRSMMSRNAGSASKSDVGFQGPRTAPRLSSSCAPGGVCPYFLRRRRCRESVPLCHFNVHRDSGRRKFLECRPLLPAHVLRPSVERACVLWDIP